MSIISFSLVVMGILGALGVSEDDSPSPEWDADRAGEVVEAGAFPLIGWWGPPPADYHFTIYRRAFLNSVPIALRHASTEALDAAQAYQLPVMLEVPGGNRYNLDALPHDVREHPAIVACLVAEEVTADTAGEVAARAERLRELVPSWQPVATLLSGADAPRWESAAETLAAAGIPVLPIALPFGADDSTDEAGLYAVLRGGAAASRKGGAPLWGMVQVTEHGDRRRASESDMRLQAYASLAYGAKGLVYFSYWGPTGGRTMRGVHYGSFAHAMVDVRRGNALYGHQKGRIINAEITLMSPHLAELEPVAVYFVGDVPEDCEPLRPGIGPITRVDSARAMVGFFRGPDGADWAMVVNRQHGARRSAQTQASTMGIAFEEDVTAIHVIERQSGLPIPVPADTGYFTVTTPGGTGNLIRFDREGGNSR